MAPAHTMRLCVQSRLRSLRPAARAAEPWTAAEALHACEKSRSYLQRLFQAVVVDSHLPPAVLNVLAEAWATWDLGMCHQHEAERAKHGPAYLSPAVACGDEAVALFGIVHVRFRIVPIPSCPRPRPTVK
jgi:hypothetical protein